MIIKAIKPFYSVRGGLIEIHGNSLNSANEIDINGVLYPAASVNDNLIRFYLPQNIGIGINQLKTKSGVNYSQPFNFRVGLKEINDFTQCLPDYSAADYKTAGKKLLPPGQLWQVKPGGVLDKIFDFCGNILKNVNDEICNLIKETDPLTANYLITEWEKTLGLPGKCSSGILGETITERRNDIYKKLLLNGGSTPAFFIELAAAFGYRITITELSADPFRVGVGSVGETPLNNSASFYAIINILNVTPEYFRVGVGRVGETPLVKYLETGLECIFNQFKPAHVIFIYDTTPPIIDTIDENGADPGDIIDENGASAADEIRENY